MPSTPDASSKGPSNRNLVRGRCDICDRRFCAPGEDRECGSVCDFPEHKLEEDKDELKILLKLRVRAECRKNEANCCGVWTKLNT